MTRDVIVRLIVMLTAVAMVGYIAISPQRAGESTARQRLRIGARVVLIVASFGSILAMVGVMIAATQFR